MKPTIAVPPSVHEEILEIARRAGRSAPFVIRRALVAAQRTVTDGEPSPPGVRERPIALPLKLGEEDDPRTLDRIDELCAARGSEPGAAVATAWAATREQFQAWVRRHEEAEHAARADDLDGALAEAASPEANPVRLAAMAAHEYVQVRARVAGNPRTPIAALEHLATARERTILARLVENPSLPAPLRQRLQDR
ncbi:MAG: hypothetical protein EXR72_23950 [Myxococcales bacterium]|nr:hypothetical protein [Myxococcales bacterium]